MAARKRAKVIRTADEFPKSLTNELRATSDHSQSLNTWTVPQIRAAVDAQLSGSFEQPAKMAASMMTDDAIFTARDTRLDPQRCIGVEVKPNKAGRAEDAKRVSDEADALYGPNGIAVSSDVLADINDTLANHAIAIGYNDHVPREDGSRVDLMHRAWPIETVRWDPVSEQLVTRARDERGYIHWNVPITHADGRWVIYSKHGDRPWRKGACILPAGLIWARHAYAMRDWSKGSASHGNAKHVAKMPEGSDIKNKDGSLTREALELLELVRAIASGDSAAGIIPDGVALQNLTNTSKAYEVWVQLAANAEKASARIYLGTDGILGAQGGAPGVDIGALFGVATTKIQGDIRTIERCFHEGTMVPWAAINHANSLLVPRRCYKMPDPDADAERESYAKRATAFQEDIKRHRDNGFAVDSKLVEKLANRYGVERPRLAGDASSAAIYQYDIQLGIVTVNEVRGFKGLAPRDGGDVTVPERDAKLAEGAPKVANTLAARRLVPVPG